MKTFINIRFVFLAILTSLLFSASSNQAYAQKVKKNSVRIKADYIKTTNVEMAFEIKATSKIDRKTIGVSNIELSILNEFDDESIKLGKATTDADGASRFVIKDFNSVKPDSSGMYNVKISFKGDSLYKRASKSVSFRDATIEAKVITKDSVKYITATLKDTARDSVLSDQILNVQIQRLFKPLKIGPDFNTTDENGTIIAAVEEGIPGVNGALTFEVVLKDSDDYGTVKTLVRAPLGVPIVDESTFDQRTMWSPKNKTPIFLLIFPNLFILGIWGLIVYLIINLFKISKSNN